MKSKAEDDRMPHALESLATELLGAMTFYDALPSQTRARLAAICQGGAHKLRKNVYETERDFADREALRAFLGAMHIVRLTAARYPIRPVDEEKLLLLAEEALKVIGEVQDDER